LSDSQARPRHGEHRETLRVSLGVAIQPRRDRTSSVRAAETLDRHASLAMTETVLFARKPYDKAADFNDN